MTDATLQLAQAAAAWLLQMLAQPWAAVCVGAWAAGYAQGRAKNQTAIIEILKGIGAGLVAGLIVWGVQTIIRGGA